MTLITPLKQNNTLIGFKVSGHANYAPYGSDIVCAAVSGITFNTINSIVELTSQYIKTKIDDGLVIYSVNKPNSKTRLLLESALIGYRGIAEQYPDYVVILEE